jgi:hypothetical protein
LLKAVVAKGLLQEISHEVKDSDFDGGIENKDTAKIIEREISWLECHPSSHTNYHSPADSIRFILTKEKEGHATILRVAKIVSSDMADKGRFITNKFGDQYFFDNETGAVQRLVLTNKSLGNLLYKNYELVPETNVQRQVISALGAKATTTVKKHSVISRHFYYHRDSNVCLPNMFL